MHKDLRSIVPLVAALLFGSVAANAADAVDNAIEVLERRDYAAAWQLLLPLAEAGDPRAQARVGLYYFGGKMGIAQDHAESFKWFIRSAKQGYGVGQYLVGISYAGGSGVTIDPLHAHVWFSLAAQTSVGSDRDDAMRFRGLMENRLSRTEIDRAKAIAERCRSSNYKECD
jgi:TPR repeat protein